MPGLARRIGNPQAIPVVEHGQATAGRSERAERVKPWRWVGKGHELTVDELQKYQRVMMSRGPTPDHRPKGRRLQIHEVADSLRPFNGLPIRSVIREPDIMFVIERKALVVTDHVGGEEREFV